MEIDQLIYLFRIILAGVCGLSIGTERRNRSKEAGIRTHFVVACGAAIMMIVSKYAFFDVLGIADVKLDPSRVASNIASGIGFLGAGMIFVHKSTITGLTTAAGIWATSGIGMAIGGGMYVVGIGATVIILAAQYLLHRDRVLNKSFTLKTLTIPGVTDSGYKKHITDVLGEMKITIQSVEIARSDDGARNYSFKIDIPPAVDEDDIVSAVDRECSLTQPS